MPTAKDRRGAEDDHCQKQQDDDCADDPKCADIGSPAYPVLTGRIMPGQPTRMIGSKNCSIFNMVSAEGLEPSTP